MSAIDTSTWFHDEDRFDSIELSVIVQYVAVDLKLCLTTDAELLSIDNMLNSFDVTAVKAAFDISVPRFHAGLIKGGTGRLMAYTYTVLKNNCRRKTM